MTTTCQFRNGPDYFSNANDVEKCKSFPSSNPRYQGFRQLHFTAGDEEQFERYRNKRNNPRKQKAVVFIDETVTFWERFHNIPAQAITNTFRYMFHKFKKGIFVQIRNNRVSVMLPFSKHHYTNEWSSQIGVDFTKYTSISDLLERANVKEGRNFKPRHVNNCIEQWYGNNAIVRYEYPVVENDSGIPMISDMLHELCRHRAIPDIEFFINKRDHPLLRKDSTESYTYLFGDNIPLVSHNYDHYAPILSMCGTTQHADICVPTWEDWARVSIEDGKYFPKSPIQKQYRFPTPWHEKKPVAVFRGTSTGSGLTPETNMRIRIALMSQETNLLDAGITKWNLRPRKIKDCPQIDTFDDELLNSIPLVPYLDIEEQSRFKYIVNIDGHVAAFRLSMELATKSVILKVESEFKLWYSSLLRPYVHYVPVKADLSNLLEQIEWCQQHDAECEGIAQNAQMFYETVLSKEGILNYLQNTLVNLKKWVGNYTYMEKSPLHCQFEHERLLVEEGGVSPTNLHPPPLQLNNMKSWSRSWDTLCALQWVLQLSRDPYHYIIREKFLQWNKRTSIEKCTLLSQPILLKRHDEMDELTHETFIGMYCINPLLKYIPNFSYTFGLFENTLVTEYFPNAMTFNEYLISREFCMKEYLAILQSVALALHVAQEQCLFTHRDLYPWNIMLVKNDQDTHYVVDIDTCIRIRTKYQPILIDYGKSHAVYNDRHYGLVHPFQTSTVHDILTLLISSLYTIIDKHTLCRRDLRTMFQLSGFFSGSQYTNYRTFSRVNELKQFLFHAKKFATMLSSPKYELESKTPYDLVKLITSITGDSNQTFLTQWDMRFTTPFFVYGQLTQSDSNVACEQELRRIETSISEMDALDVVLTIQSLFQIHRLFPSIPVTELVDKIQTHTPLSFPIPQKLPNIHKLRFIDYDTDTFDNVAETEALYRRFLAMESLPANLAFMKMRVLYYLLTTPDEKIFKKYHKLISFDHKQYLRYIADRTTFLHYSESAQFVCK